MNPNSANQWWSKWVWFVATSTTRPFSEAKVNLARFARKCFGSASQMNIRETLRGYIIEVLTEGHPVTDAAYVQIVHQNWEHFLRVGFGSNCTIRTSTKLMAGSPQDGRPSEQMLIIPPLELKEN